MNVCLLVTPQYRDIRVEFHKGIYVWYRYVYSVRLVSVCGYTCGIDMSILFERLPRMCVWIYTCGIDILFCLTRMCVWTLEFYKKLSNHTAPRAVQEHLLICKGVCAGGRKCTSISVSMFGCFCDGDTKHFIGRMRTV